MVLQSDSDKVPVILLSLIDIGLLFIGYHIIVTVCTTMYAYTSSNCYSQLHTG